MKKYLAIFIPLLVLAGIVIIVITLGSKRENSNNVVRPTKTNEQTASQEVENIFTEKIPETKTEGTPLPSKSSLATKAEPKNSPGVYTNYSESELASAVSRGDKIVLFFHAQWCPFCRSADSAFLANLDKIPSKVTLLKTDYDTETELKKKYVVTYQHTFVQIDQNGDLVTKWNGGDVDNLVKYIK